MHSVKTIFTIEYFPVVKMAGIVRDYDWNYYFCIIFTIKSTQEVFNGSTN